MKSISNITKKILGAKWLLPLILAIFIFQASWIAFSARYPMAFDEEYHVEIIKVYAQQWGPLITEQPEGPATWGALTRDPSYFHHYIMSFPYRWISNVTDSQMVLIISLRLMNMVMFTIGLALFWLLLRRSGASRRVSNASLAIFTAIPVVPLLAAHINYDNLQFPLTALTLLLALRVANDYKLRRVVNVKAALLLLTLCMFTSLVKFTYLPFFAAIVLYELYILLRYRVKRKNSLSLFERTQRNWAKLHTTAKVLLVGSFVVMTGFFTYTYGVNMAIYKIPIPQCGQVLGVARCQTYGPWARNYQYAQQGRSVNPNPAAYSVTWTSGMLYRSFFVINGSEGAARYANHTAPLPILAFAAACMLAVVATLRYGRRISKDYPDLAFIVFACMVYIAAVWGRNYNDYLQLGQPVAVNGRYLTLVYMPLIAFAILCTRLVLRKYANIQTVVFTIFMGMMLIGGGVISFWRYSNADWYWQNDVVIKANAATRKAVTPLFLWRQ